jgi:hypothetical protein
MKSTSRIQILFLLQSGFICKGQINHCQKSIYDDPGNKIATEVQLEPMKHLDSKKIFDYFQNQLLPKLPKKHQDYFQPKSEIKLLSFLTGDIFSNKKEDFIFVVFDKKNVRISILVYNELTNQYLELYRDIKVQNDLLETNCYFSSFRTLDYQICNEIIYQEDELITDPKRFLEWEICKFTDIEKDQTFVLSDGCLSKKSKNNYLNSFKSLCFSTSIAYNNWECLRYDRDKKIFILFYSQAFAD